MQNNYFIFIILFFLLLSCTSIIVQVMTHFFPVNQCCYDHQMAVLVFVQAENSNLLHIDGLLPVFCLFTCYHQNLIFGAVASGDHHTSAFHTMPQRYNSVQPQTSIHPLCQYAHQPFQQTPTAEVHFAAIKLLTVGNLLNQFIPPISGRQANNKIDSKGLKSGNQKQRER